MSNYNQSVVFSGLGTQSFTVPDASLYTVKGKISLPTLVQGALAPQGVPAQSALVVTVNQNGSPMYVGGAGAEGFKILLNCAANDVVTVVMSSAAAVDQLLNVIKSTIQISAGE